VATVAEVAEPGPVHKQVAVAGHTIAALAQLIHPEAHHLQHYLVMDKL
jgi:hypothetical protein